MTTLNLSIADEDDDGYSSGTLWQEGSILASNSYTRAPAWRFVNVTVPNASTINSATLNINCDTAGAGTATVVGENVDDASNWANLSSNSAATMSKTTATQTYTAGSTGAKTVDVTAIVQEIVNRAGWASGNALRIGFGTVSSISSLVAFTDGTGTLDIDYGTAGGQPTMRRFGGTPGMGQGQTFGRSW